MSYYDPMGLLEAEAEDERHWARFSQVPVFDFGIEAEPIYIAAGAIIKGYAAHWWLPKMVGSEYGSFYAAVDYEPPRKPQK